MTIGAGQRRQRNRIAQLNRELRQMVLGMLLDGETYEACRVALRAEGVSEAAMPGDSAFLAYRQGPEYLDAMARWQGLAEQAKLDNTVASALAGGAMDDATDLVLYECLKVMMRSLQDPEVDAAKVATAVAGIKRVLGQQAGQTAERKLEALRAELETQAAAKQGQGNLAKIAGTLSELLGVPASKASAGGGKP